MHYHKTTYPKTAQQYREDQDFSAFLQQIRTAAKAQTSHELDKLTRP
jgi:hypothetical protein